MAQLKFNSILVVCTGNICRSPIGERLLRKAMESEHIAQVTAIAPEVRGKTMLFGQWLEQKEIPDPYRKSQDAFEHVYGMLERASQEWAKRLSR